MKILMVNKFLYPHGGSETYILDIGKQLIQMGHEVQYFGMEDENRTVGNRAESYTSSMDFHAGGVQKILYPFKIIYSTEARKKIRIVLDDFKPDAVHLNNINFQLTPSIIYEVRKWEKQTKHKVKIVYTAHDSQWVCPNHMLMIPSTKELCFKCEGKKYGECMKNKCIHDSKVRSILGSVEAYVYSILETYKKVDTIICPSFFMKRILSTNSQIAERLVVMHNYCTISDVSEHEKENYVLYFGRYSEEKGIETLIEACKKSSNVAFIFAGNGPLKAKIEGASNIKNVGFLSGEHLKNVIAKAKFVVVPSIWYENCPFTVIEAQKLGTPLIASNIGGIPELIDEETGVVFESGNVENLVSVLNEFDAKKYNNRLISEKSLNRFSAETHYKKLIEIYTS